MLGAEVGPADDDGDRAAGLGEEQRGLAGGVAAADDHDRRAGALARLQLGGGVVHAAALELVEAGGVEPAVAGAGGGDHGAAGDLGAVGQADDEMPGLLAQRRRPRTGSVRWAPNFSACTTARWVRSPPEMPVGKPR